MRAVFVYGTLKPQERNNYFLDKGGKYKLIESYVDGFDLYHLHRENYPGVVRGSHRVYGFTVEYEDINDAIDHLDELEDVNSNPPLYNRVATKSVTNDGREIDTWIYTYANHMRLFDESAAFVPSGVWKSK